MRGGDRAARVGHPVVSLADCHFFRTDRLKAAAFPARRTWESWAVRGLVVSQALQPTVTRTEPGQGGVARVSISRTPNSRSLADGEAHELDERAEAAADRQEVEELAERERADGELEAGRLVPDAAAQNGAAAEPRELAVAAGPAQGRALLVVERQPAPHELRAAHAHPEVVGEHHLQPHGRTAAAARSPVYCSRARSPTSMRPRVPSVPSPIQGEGGAREFAAVRALPGEAGAHPLARPVQAAGDQAVVEDVEEVAEGRVLAQTRSSSSSEKGAGSGPRAPARPRTLTVIRAGSPWTAGSATSWISEAGNSKLTRELKRTASRPGLGPLPYRHGFRRHPLEQPDGLVEVEAPPLVEEEPRYRTACSPALGRPTFPDPLRCWLLRTSCVNELTVV